MGARAIATTITTRETARWQKFDINGRWKLLYNRNIWRHFIPKLSVFDGYHRFLDHSKKTYPVAKTIVIVLATDIATALAITLPTLWAVYLFTI